MMNRKILRFMLRTLVVLLAIALVFISFKEEILAPRLTGLALVFLVALSFVPKKGI